MLLATLVCSDPDCDEELEIVIEDMGELAGLVCGCGYGFVLSTVSELANEEAKVVSIQFRRGRVLRRRLAA